MAVSASRGYGSSPGHGNILRGVTVARFDRCVFDRVAYEVRPRAPATFAGCTFQDCGRMEKVIQRSLMSTNTRSARFEDCRATTTLAPDATTRRVKLKRDLKVLFPAFKGR